jgi:hypothetical protein
MDAAGLNEYIVGLFAYLLLSSALMGAGLFVKRSAIDLRVLKNFKALLWKIPVLLSIWFLYIHEMMLLNILLELLACYLIVVIMIVYTGILILLVIKFLRFIGWTDE